MKWLKIPLAAVAFVLSIAGTIASKTIVSACYNSNSPSTCTGISLASCIAPNDQQYYCKTAAGISLFEPLP
jgi:hypothetical protein